MGEAVVVAGEPEQAGGEPAFETVEFLRDVAEPLRQIAGGRPGRGRELRGGEGLDCFGVQGQEVRMDRADVITGRNLFKLRPELELVVTASGLSERPSGEVGEGMPAHQATGLGVEELLVRNLRVEPEPPGDSTGVSEPLEPYGVEHEKAHSG